VCGAEYDGGLTRGWKGFGFEIFRIWHDGGSPGAGKVLGFKFQGVDHRSGLTQSWKKCMKPSHLGSVIASCSMPHPTVPYSKSPLRI
jgi:hypothetical protein